MNQLDTLLAKIEGKAKQNEALLAEVIEEIKAKQEELAELKHKPAVGAKELLEIATKSKVLESEIKNLLAIEADCREGIINAGGTYIEELAEVMRSEYDCELVEARDKHNSIIVEYLKDVLNHLNELISEKKETCKEAGELALKRIATVRKYTKLSYHDPNQSSILFLSSISNVDSFSDRLNELIKELERFISRYK